jgi:hypothetical protein
MCSFFSAQVAAQELDDGAETVRLYQAALVSTPSCQQLPWDVTKSINLNNGIPVPSIPGTAAVYNNDANVKNLLNNCITTVANSNEAMFKKDNVKKTLADKIRAAANTFVSFIALAMAKQQNVKINSPVVAVGIRG